MKKVQSSRADLFKARARKVRDEIIDNINLPSSFDRAEKVVTDVFCKYVDKRDNLEYQIVESKLDPKFKLELLQSDLFKFKDSEKMGRDMMVVLMITSKFKVGEEIFPEYQKAFHQLRLDTCAFSVAYKKTKKRFEELVAKQQAIRKVR